MAAGDGKAGAVPTFSFTASEAGTNGTIPELETESANGATTGEELVMVERVCGELEKKRQHTLIWINIHIIIYNLLIYIIYKYVFIYN